MTAITTIDIGPDSEFRETVEHIFECTPKLHQWHHKNNAIYALFDRIIKAYFSNYKADILDAAPFQSLCWPHISLGNVTSHDLFAFDAFMVFSFYSINRSLYKTAFDIGANIGLHSLVLNRFGYEVYAFEPDPLHHELLMKNITANRCKNIHVFKKAVSDRSGVTEFIRVKGNTTASHIPGSRGFYGDVEHLKIEAVAYQDIGVHPDLMKVDIEGHERNVLMSIDHKRWETIDAFVEVHTPDNSKAIFDYFQGSAINIFAQKVSWKRAERAEEMPMNNKEGNIFISKKFRMPWGFPE